MSHETGQPRKILLVEDDEVMGESLVQALSLEDCSVEWRRTGAGALEALAGQPSPMAVLCDIRLPDMTGEALFEAQSTASPGSFLFMTGYGEIDQAVRLMRAGAADYLTKPFEMEALLSRLFRLAPCCAGDSGALGPSPEMCEIESLLVRAAPHDGPVFFTGETGVGKSVCARHLHGLSRPGSPFMAVNCAAIPADLLESEIFGHERGAFPGAVERHPGYAERAGDGVLFLDEIGAASADVQAKLLRLFEQSTFYRLGGEEEIPFRARIAAATNRDPVTDALRADLFHRLSAFTVEIPPLRDRPEDIDWLLRKFVAEFSRNAARELHGVSALTVEAARSHDWPGNGHELRNRAERAVALGTGDRIMPDDLFPRKPGAAEQGGALADLRDQTERRAILGALRDANDRPGDAARMLGISRTTLWEKMKRLGIRN